MEGKILLIDIESSPSLGWTWAKWKQDVIDFEKNWYILCFGARWLGKKTFVKALPDYKSYKKDRENDKELVKDIWKLLNEADVVVGHNLDAFDIKKIQTRFLIHGLEPPSPFRTIDTKKLARKHFGFNSNKLDELARDLGIGRKLQHEGFVMWQGCMKGDLKWWKKMKAYNKQDVELLEKVYLRIRPWAKINLGIYFDKTCCPKCGSTKGFKRSGFYSNSTTKYQVWRCKNCRGQARTTLNIRETKPLVSV